MYTLPQEIEVWYVIPAIRRELSSLLTRKYGLSYNKAGEVLGVSKAAISQYNKNKRASKVTLHDKVIKEIERTAKIMARDKSKTVQEILKVLKFMRDKKLSFEFCKGGRHNHEDCQEVMVAYEKYWK